MEKLWSGRQLNQLNKAADDFNTSIHIDSKMYIQDIKGSIAHAKMLGKQNIISSKDKEAIILGLENILQEIMNGTLAIDTKAEDIHSFIETELTSRIGDSGKKLHTARSRNDQVALDIRMYLKEEINIIISLIKDLLTVLADKASDNSETVMPGYTHLQRAQPITFGHHLMAYAMMFTRDIERLTDCSNRMNKSPLGSGALAGTTHPINREFAANELGFDAITLNSIDGVSDRDFCIELNSALAIVMMHLSRFCEEIILWCSKEYSFIELDDSFTTGSSIMPQKKNPDIAELIRGKTGRVYGNLMGILTILKALPLAYNKDMQEDKENVFDSVDTVKACITVFTPMINIIRVNESNMYRAAGGGYINATDLADYLAKKGIPFRSAYKITGAIVAYCIAQNKSLEEMNLSEYKNFSEDFEKDLYQAIDLKECVNKRTSTGGPSNKSLNIQIKYVREVCK